MPERAPGEGWQEIVDRLNVETTESALASFDRGETAGAFEFLWLPARAFASAFASARRGSKLSAAVLSGYRELLRSAKLWDAERLAAEELVDRLVVDSREVLVRRAWRAPLESVLRDEAGEPIEAGRGGASRVPTEQGTVIVRRFRRGGLMRSAGETYFGLRPRPTREFWTLIRARRRGLPVPDPLAAVVERRLGILYRGTLVMAEIGEAVSLWEFLRSGGDFPAIAAPLATALRHLHDSGLHHRDLNLNNILVVGRREAPEFAFVDLDRARLGRGSVGDATRRRSLRRIRRSARRLDPSENVLPRGHLEILERRYWQTPGDNP